MSTSGADRPLRADAALNRERLVDAARTAFTEAGGPVPLDAVARAAGLGIGTLYRHFPTREALVEAVYLHELDALEQEAGGALGAGTGREALRRWMDDYAGFVATKRGMGDVLRAAWSEGTLPASTTRPRVRAVVGRLLAAGVADGSLRDDLDAEDVTAALVGVFLTTRGSDDPDQVGRLLDLLVDGLAPRERDPR